MADVKQALDAVLLEEDRKLSAKVVDLHDGAGWTRLGVTSRNHPELIPTGFFSTMLREQALTVAEEVFNESYAAPLHIAEIADLALARAVLSLGVNASVHTSAKLLQQACCAHDLHIACDGIIGPSSLAAVRQINPTELLATFSDLARAHYRELAEKDTSNAHWLKGWLNRVNGWQAA